MVLLPHPFTLQTLQECARTLKKAGKMDADCTVICIIPPSLGGQNKLANYAVLPKGLLPAEPSGTSAAEAYCQLMTKILGRPMVQAAVNACGGSYQGPSVDDLATAWGDRSRKTALHPWGSSGRGGGNGAGASGSQAQEADAEADAAGTSGAQNGA